MFGFFKDIFVNDHKNFYERQSESLSDYFNEKLYCKVNVIVAEGAYNSVIYTYSATSIRFQFTIHRDGDSLFFENLIIDNEKHPEYGSFKDFGGVVDLLRKKLNIKQPTFYNQC